MLNKIFEKIIYYIKGGVARARFLGVNVGDGCFIAGSVNLGSEPYLIEIGSKVTITDGVVILTHDGSTRLIVDGNGRRYSYGKVKIGNNVFIGVNSVIMPNVSIGDNVIIGAGTIVTKSIESNSICIGVPARKIGTFKDHHDKLINKLPNKSDFNNFSDKRKDIISYLQKHE